MATTAKRILLLGLALLVGAALLELGVRILAPQQLIQVRPEIWTPDDTGLGHRLAAKVDTRINTGEREVRVLTDAHGRRTGPDSPLRPRRVVLALGDSFLEALAVEYEDSITGRMEALLADRWQEPVRVLNTGVSGTGPNHYRLRAERELARDSVEAVVVFLFLGNDLIEKRVDAFPPRQSRLERPFGWPRGLGWRPLMDAWIHPLYTELRRRSHGVVLLKRSLLGLLVRLGFSDHAFPPLLLRENAGSPRFARTAEAAREIADLARGHGARPLFVLLPADYQVSPELGHAFAAGAGLPQDRVDLEQSRSRLREELAQRGLEVVDPFEALQQAAAQGAAPFGRVDRHLSPAGQDVVAREVVRRLTGEGP